MKKLLVFALMLIFAFSAFAQNPVTLRTMAGAWEAGGMTAADFYGFNLPKIAGMWYFVDKASGNAAWDGLTVGTAVTTVPIAYAKCTTGRGDGIVILSRAISGTSNSTLISTRMLWTKYGITVIGVAAPNGYFGRARITHAAAHDSMNSLMLLTGMNNTFININFYNNPENDGDPVSATEMVSAVHLKGPRNAFINCHFNCSPQSANAYKTDLQISVGADETVFDNCYFGSSSYDAGDNAACWIYLDGAAAQMFWTDCTFLQQVSSGTAFGGFETSGATVLNGVDIFKRCVFAVWRANNHAAICASWFIGTLPNTGNIAMLDCMTMGFTAIDAQTNNNVVWTNQDAAAAEGGVGVSVK